MTIRTHNLKMIAALTLVTLTAAGLVSCGGGGSSGTSAGSGDQMTIMPRPPQNLMPSPTQDLIVHAPSVGPTSVAPGETFTLLVTVQNWGQGQAEATTVRYYRSTDTTITTSDTLEGTAPVSALDFSQGSGESISLTAPATAGTYYYGACVDAVPGEYDTTNNCSSESARLDVN